MMKKYTAIACTSALVLSMMPQEDVSAKKLILRGVVKQDTTMYEHIGKDPITVIPAGEVILIRQRDKVWTKVEFNNEYGYVLSKHLKFSKTNKQKEEELEKAGKTLTKKAKAFRKVVNQGNIDQIVVDALKYDFEVSQYDTQVTSVNPGKAARERLTKAYTNPARRELKRIKHELIAWDQLKKAEVDIKAMQYDEAKKSYQSAMKHIKAGQKWRKKMKYEDLSKKFQKTLTQRTKKINTRFTYSTFTDLVNEGHVKFLADFQFTPLSATVNFIDSDGKTQTNGFVTKANALSQSSVLIHLRNARDEVYGRDVPIFKKMRYTFARSEKSNTDMLSAPVTMTLRGTKSLLETTTIEPMNEPIEKETKIVNESTILFEFKDVPPNMALVNLKFYR